jgi:AraC-like DNA-binding protein
MPVPYIMGRALAGFSAYLAARGIDAAPLLNTAVLCEADIVSVGNYICQNKFATLLESAAEAARDQCLGAEFSLKQPYGFSGTFGALMAAAPTLRDRLNVQVKYSPLMVSLKTTEAIKSKEGLCIQWTFGDSATPTPQFSSWLLAKVVRSVRFFAGSSWNPSRIELVVPNEFALTPNSRFPSPNVTCSRKIARIFVENELLDLSSDTGDPHAYEMLKHLADRRLRDRQAETLIVGELRDAIIAALPRGSVTLNMISDEIGIAPAFIQNRLYRARTTFADFIDNTRAERAHTLITLTELPLSEIALQVGLSEQSALNRAVRRWFGTTPRQLRQDATQPKISAPARAPEVL